MKVLEDIESVCPVCLNKGNVNKINAKIIEENNIKTLGEALGCDELWDLGNGRTLCIDCHCRNGRPNISRKSLSLKI